MKEELVTGFSGEKTDINVALVTIYLITNYLAYQVLIGFLVAHSSWFKELRTDIYGSRSKIVMCSIFDVICSVPVIFVIADYEKAFSYHLGAIALILALLAYHKMSGR